MNPRHRKKAVALTYHPGTHDAPIISAKGVGSVADTILARAREHDIPIKENRSLVEVLSKLDLHEQIPPELYQVAAEILAFVYKLENHAGKRPNDS